MSVSEELPDVPMPADKRHLSHAQAHLEEAANRLMSQIVEMQVLDASTLSQALPGQAHRVGAHREHPFATIRLHNS